MFRPNSIALGAFVSALGLSVGTAAWAEPSPYGPQHGQYPGYETEHGSGTNYGAAHDESATEIPPISVRVDPLNWLLFGRLGLELEIGLWELITIETVPLFVTSESPPLFSSLRSRDTELTQRSAGWGPLAGASIGVGFWLRGTPFEGNVIRFELTNYAFAYETTDDSGVIDHVSHTERRLVGYFGSAYRVGAFTIMTAFGLGYELNHQVRCFDGPVATTECGNLNGLDIKLDRSGASVADLNGSLAPVYLAGRISFGVSF